MAFSFMMKSFTAVVCTLLLNCVGSVPIQKQFKSSLLEKISVHKRSADTVEFLMDQDSHSTFNGQQDSPLYQTATASQQAFNYDLTCPDKVSTGRDDPIHKRSSCPWYYEASHDSKRFPTVTLNAKSLCNYAIDSSNTLECSPVTQTITVLRQQENKDSSGNFVWQEGTETIVIGFTSTGRRLAQNSETQQTTPSSDNQPTPDFAK